MFTEADNMADQDAVDFGVVIEACENSRKVFAAVLRAVPNLPEATQWINRIDQRIEQLHGEQKTMQQAREELSGRIDTARKLQATASSLTKGEVPELEQCLLRLEDVRAVLKQVLDQDPGHPEATRVLEENERITKTVAGRRDDLIQRQALLASAVREGGELLDKALGGTSGDMTDLRQALEECQAAESAFRRALTLKQDHPEALEKLEQAQTLRQHLDSTIEIEVEKGRREDDIQTRLAGFAARLTEAERSRLGDAETIAGAIKVVDEIGKEAAVLATSDPDHEGVSSLGARILALKEELQSRHDGAAPAVETPAVEAPAAREEAVRRAGKMFRKAQNLRKEMKYEADRMHDLLRNALATLEQAGVAEGAKDKAGKLRSQIENMLEKVAPNVEFARKARQIDEGLDGAEKLIDAGRFDDARGPLHELRQVCRDEPDLVDQLQEIDDLLAQTGKDDGPRKGLWIGVAAASLVVVAAIVAVVMLKGSGEPAAVPEPVPPSPKVVPVDPEQALRQTVEGHMDEVREISGQERFRDDNEQMAALWNNLAAVRNRLESVMKLPDKEWTGSILENLERYEGQFKPRAGQGEGGSGIAGEIFPPGLDVPAAGAEVVFRNVGEDLWITAQTDGSGRYRAALAPGRYVPVGVRFPDSDYIALGKLAGIRLGESWETFDAKPEKR